MLVIVIYPEADDVIFISAEFFRTVFKHNVAAYAVDTCNVAVCAAEAVFVFNPVMVMGQDDQVNAARLTVLVSELCTGCFGYFEIVPVFAFVKLSALRASRIPQTAFRTLPFKVMRIAYVCYVTALRASIFLLTGTYFLPLQIVTIFGVHILSANRAMVTVTATGDKFNTVADGVLYARGHVTVFASDAFMNFVILASAQILRRNVVMAMLCID